MKWPTVYQRQDENVWVTYCKKRVARNNSLNISCNGECGSGKSWAIIGFARQYDPNWTLDNLYFRASEFVRDINNDKFPKGSLVMLDEASIDMSNASWQNELNKAMSLVFQTVRHRCLIICLTFPYLSFLSSGVRKLMTAQFEVMGYDKQNNSRIKGRVMEYNGNLDKYYRKRLLVKTLEDGSFIYCNQTKIPKADNEILKEYEKRKKAFTTEHFGIQADRLEAFERKQLQPVKNKNDLTPRQEEVLKLLKNNLSVEEVAIKLDCSKVNIFKIKRSLRNKGHNV